jgi:hypothetical protein
VSSAEQKCFYFLRHKLHGLGKVIASPAPAFRSKLSLDKQKQPPYTPAPRKQCLIKKAELHYVFPAEVVDIYTMMYPIDAQGEHALQYGSLGG